MTIVFNQTATAKVLDDLVDQTMMLHLYSNNRNPVVGDTIVDYTEVVGGGYAALSLVTANWVVTPGAPSVALYNAFRNFVFTSATDNPGKVFGYYIVDAAGDLLLAERFFEGENESFTPILNTVIRVRPKIASDNLAVLE